MYPGKSFHFLTMRMKKNEERKKERIFVTITNRSSQIKFIVVVSSCTRTIGKLKEIWKRKMLNAKNYLTTLNQRKKFSPLL